MESMLCVQNRAETLTHPSLQRIVVHVDILYAVKGAKWAAVGCDSFVVVFHWDPAEELRSQRFV